jgi:hypothetical protein
VVAVEAFPTKAPLNVGEFNTPVVGLKVSFVLLTLTGKLPVLPFTNVTGMKLFVAKSSVMATLDVFVALVALLAIPFDDYKFAIVTYEHDHYVDMTNSYRSKSRRYMELMGYELVVANVGGNDFCPFEDWWVHPDLVDKETIQRFKSIQDVTDVRTYMYTS